MEDSFLPPGFADPVIFPQKPSTDTPEEVQEVITQRTAALTKTTQVSFTGLKIDIPKIPGLPEKGLVERISSLRAQFVQGKQDIIKNLAPPVPFPTDYLDNLTAEYNSYSSAFDSAKETINEFGDIE
jgi:hypothetical protein